MRELTERHWGIRLQRQRTNVAPERHVGEALKSESKEEVREVELYG